MNTTMATKFELVAEITEKLNSFNEEIYLDSTPCREGKLISINPTDKKVKYVNVWKMKEINLIDLSPYALSMINSKLDDTLIKKNQGFDKEYYSATIKTI